MTFSQLKEERDLALLAEKQARQTVTARELRIRVLDEELKSARFELEGVKRELEAAKERNFELQREVKDLKDKLEIRSDAEKSDSDQAGRPHWPQIAEAQATQKLPVSGGAQAAGGDGDVQGRNAQ